MDKRKPTKPTGPTQGLSATDCNLYFPLKRLYETAQGLGAIGRLLCKSERAEPADDLWSTGHAIELMANDLFEVDEVIRRKVKARGLLWVPRPTARKGGEA